MCEKKSYFELFTDLFTVSGLPTGLHTDFLGFFWKGFDHTFPSSHHEPHLGHCKPLEGWLIFGGWLVAAGGGGWGGVAARGTNFFDKS